MRTLEGIWDDDIPRTPVRIPNLTQWWGLCGHMILRAIAAVV
jgi:hypothetical protein